MSRKPSEKSHLEETLVLQMKRENLPPAVRGHRFHPVRKWEFDFCYPEHKIAFEVEGGIWISGRHNRASGFIKDIEKYNAAGLLGWRVFKLHGEMIVKGNRQFDEGWKLIQEVLKTLNILEADHGKKDNI